MKTIPAVRVPPLANQILESMTEAIMDGTHPPGSRLPSEVKLAADFGVSRGTIRTSIDSLEQKGLVIRKQGVGTFVTSLSRITNPFNMFSEWDELIENCGFKSGVSFSPPSVVYPNEEVRTRLGIGDEDKVLQIPIVYTANGDPVIHSWDWIPISYIDEEIINSVLLDPSITVPWIPFIAETIKLGVHHHVSSIWPEIAKNCDLCDLDFSVYEPNTPILIVEGISSNSEGVPLDYSIQYFLGNFMKLQVIRNINQLKSK